MGRIYPVPFSGTVTAAGTNADLLSLAPGDDKPIRLRGFRLGQISEVGDAAEEGLRVTVKRHPATFSAGSGGGAITAAPPMGSSAEPVWGFTARSNDTTPSSSSGTTQVMDEIGWNIRQGTEIWYPDSDFAPGAKQTEGIAIVMETTLADDFTFSGVAFVEEIG